MEVYTLLRTWTREQAKGAGEESGKKTEQPQKSR